ncbi:hypothetical protein Clacol_009521 [Clathrus columnatus]|uniref:Uncharacterized protein n=1 Tax=Clathrus columnatus TaxID=1419009 RepID=A0AAV5AR32_9AGAM|nr:hypothetical protein Clacol_009521 [Clathrus columnatus]
MSRTLGGCSITSAKALRVLLPATVLLGLSYFAHTVVFDILFPYINDLNLTPVVPCPAEYDGSSMYRRQYFGGLLPGLERSLCPLVAFFYPVVQADVKPHYYREFMIASFSNFSVVVCATFVEASRMQRGLIGPFWILLPVLTGVVYQFITGAVTLPYLWTIIIVAQRRGLIKSAPSIDECDGEGIALGMLLGYVVPTYLMLFHSDIPSIVAWQIFPVIIGAVCGVYILLRPRSNKPSAYNNTIQTTYGILFIFLTLINFYFIVSNNFNLTKVINIWFPPFTFRFNSTILQNFADFSAIVLQWDLMLIFGGTCLASLWFAKNIKQVLAIAAWYVGPGLLLGPGPAIAAVLMWREGELRRQNEKIKGE